MSEKVKYRNNHVINIGKDGELDLSSFSSDNYGDNDITALTLNTLDLDWYNSNISYYQQLISFYDNDEKQNENNSLMYEFVDATFKIPEEITKNNQTSLAYRF